MDRLVALLNLAERGVGGERTVARNKLNAQMADLGLSIEDVILYRDGHKPEVKASNTRKAQYDWSNSSRENTWTLREKRHMAAFQQWMDNITASIKICLEDLKLPAIDDKCVDFAINEMSKTGIDIFSVAEKFLSNRKRGFLSDIIFFIQSRTRTLGSLNE